MTLRPCRRLSNPRNLVATLYLDITDACNSRLEPPRDSISTAKWRIAYGVVAPVFFIGELHVPSLVDYRVCGRTRVRAIRAPPSEKKKELASLECEWSDNARALSLSEFALVKHDTLTDAYANAQVWSRLSSVDSRSPKFWDVRRTYIGIRD